MSCIGFFVTMFLYCEKLINDCSRQVQGWLAEVIKRRLRGNVLPTLLVDH